MELLKILGTNNKMIKVKDNTIKIIKHGTLFSAKREKVISVLNVHGVEVKKPGVMVNGYIQIQIAGQISSNSSFKVTGGAYDAVSDENAVVFSGDDNYKIALQMQQHILNYAATQQNVVSAPSEADELLKFKKLLDDGVITQDEFNAKKKQLLGL